jgi:hypothetical protein
MNATDLNNLGQRIVAATGGKWVLPKGLEYDCDRWWATRATDTPTFTPIPTEWAEAIIERSAREWLDADTSNPYPRGWNFYAGEWTVERHTKYSEGFKPVERSAPTLLAAIAAALEAKE